MRLVLPASGIVFGFFGGAWGISRLVPDETPAWFSLTLCVAWLFVLIGLALRIGNQSKRMLRDQQRLLVYGLLTAALMACFIVALTVFNIEFPRWAAEAVLGAIAGVVFLFSRYMERRWVQGKWGRLKES